MSDRGGSTGRGPFAARGLERPEDEALRLAGHERLIELLAAHADGELPPETASQLDAHLVGCERCRRELGVHVALRQRLAAEPLVPASPALLERITSAVQALPAPVPAPPRRPALASIARALRAHQAVAAALLALVLLASAAAVGQLRSAREATRAGLSGPALAADTAPLLRTVFDDYRGVAAGDLPGRARDLAAVRAAVPFPVEPLRAARLRLLGAWTATLAGEAVAVLAYRWDDRLLLQYVVPEHLFFRHPAVRSAVAGGRLMAATDGAQALVGWPEAAAGSLLVGDAQPAQLAQVRADAARADAGGR